VGGGSKLLVKARWSQKLLYNEGYFVLNLPFSFPVYVIPAGKISKREKIQLSINTGVRKEVVCRTATHPLKVSLACPKPSLFSWHVLLNTIVGKFLGTQASGWQN